MTNRRSITSATLAILFYLSVAVGACVAVTVPPDAAAGPMAETHIMIQ